jgi:dienelactone hydrolase
MCIDDCDGGLSRRETLMGAMALATAGAASASSGADVSFRRGAETVQGRLFRPAKSSAPALLVAQGNPGFIAYLEPFCARLAGMGFAVLFVDVFGHFPPFPAGDEERARWREAAGRATRWRNGGKDFEAGLRWMRDQGIANKTLAGGIGFCGGATMLAHYAAAGAQLQSLILFYANARLSNSFKSASDPLPDLVDIAYKINAPTQAHYGELDPTAKAEDGRVFEQRMIAAGLRPSFFYYEGAGHGFMKSDEPLEQDRTWGHVPEAARAAEDRMTKELRARLLS